MSQPEPAQEQVEQIRAVSYHKLDRRLARAVDGLDLQILLALMAYPSATRDRQVWASNATLGEAAGLKPRALQIRLNRLESRGFIRRKPASQEQAGKTHRLIELKFLDPAQVEQLVSQPRPVEPLRTSTKPLASEQPGAMRPPNGKPAQAPSEAEIVAMAQEWNRLGAEIFVDYRHETRLGAEPAQLLDGSKPYTQKSLTDAATWLAEKFHDSKSLRTYQSRLATIYASVWCETDVATPAIAKAIEFVARGWQFGNVKKPSSYLCNRLKLIVDRVAKAAEQAIQRDEHEAEQASAQCEAEQVAKANENDRLWKAYDKEQEKHYGTERLALDILDNIMVDLGFSRPDDPIDFKPALLMASHYRNAQAAVEQMRPKLLSKSDKRLHDVLSAFSQSLIKREYGQPYPF